MAKPRSNKPALKVIPLGGLDGIGRNMTAFEYGRDMILVDAGIMFPNDEQPGIDLVLPDYTYVLENEEKLRGIVITHGHEDHTGAVPYLLADLNHKAPMYGTKLTLGLIQGKLNEHNLKSPKLVEVKDGTHIRLGSFDIDFFTMTHSIPAGLGLYISTPQGTILHTGDFKLDQTPIDGCTPNYQAIGSFARQGIDLLLSDSTNATRPGFTQSEAAVGAALRHVIKNAPGRVIVASFSSHIHRLQQVCDASVAVGRKVIVTGRSMVQNTKIARELGYLKIADKDIIDAYDAHSMPDNKVVILCTGSQGEPLAALGRMATGEHKNLSITERDTVIISATPVPGNEKNVAQVTNELSKIGCTIYDKNNALVHVSGHGCAEELKLMLAMTKPTYFMPVHGEAMHLLAHAKLGREMGIPENRIFICDNGETLQMRAHKVRRGATIESGTVFVDGLQVGDAEPAVLRDRKRLSEDGSVFASVIITKKGHRVRDVQFTTRGITLTENEMHADDIIPQIKKAVSSKPKDADNEVLRKAVRNSISNYLWSKTRTRPLVVALVQEV